MTQKLIPRLKLLWILVNIYYFNRGLSSYFRCHAALLLWKLWCANINHVSWYTVSHPLRCHVTLCLILLDNMSHSLRCHDTPCRILLDDMTHRVASSYMRWHTVSHPFRCHEAVLVMCLTASACLRCCEAVLAYASVRRCWPALLQGSAGLCCCEAVLACATVRQCWPALLWGSAGLRCCEAVLPCAAVHWHAMHRTVTAASISTSLGCVVIYSNLFPSGHYFI